ncbi:hypothetical protein LCM4577_26700 [Mesorhizobium sp. LCM 4577]|uniref:hypothetical protein n=1 Tax=Mesorhizobium sp. LCM 4577 TaxID=1848288 RepID=UPI0008D9EA1B|nr:hypothetical protein [Mesorhizobium sp. LCM 4577]OHV67148.1 hypothetical protein LCM4577_26700 [Mesorhizobium sp. LCM 4577]
MGKLFEYPCVTVRQSTEAKTILLFSASATEIERWIGIPQRLSLSGTETAGFQRTVSPVREAALRKFFAEPNNVIQNPLLCAVRQAAGIRVTYKPDPADQRTGHVMIELEDFEAMTLQQLLSAARAYLESRVSGLATRPIPTELIVELETQINAGASLAATPDEEGATQEPDDGDEVSLSEPAEDALFDESQISTFWDHLRAREEITKKLGAEAPDELAGFSREILISYLRPIILVDGQHRLRGAILAAQDQANTSAQGEDLVASGALPAEAASTVASQIARHLPVSLLMDDSPAEHVFQYVLVNQKATPVPKALLGTIISTSLAEGELATIAARLEDAKIPLEGARVISILSRAEDSPFRGLVAKGFGSDDSSKLQWNVVGSLSDIFRYLKGARFYHETTDHALTWQKHHLAGSAIISDWQALEFEGPQDFWQDLSGPWMAVFKRFWSEVRKKLASEDINAPNFWGDPRSSNIFNKPMLHILAADFFSYLREQKTKIGSTEDIPALVNGWLEYVSGQYFARDWKLSGVKKDSVGTRRQWSKLWATHRQQGGNPPAAAEFSKILKA